MLLPDIYGRHHRMTSIGQGTNHMNYRKAIPILLTFPTALAAALLLAAAPEATGQTCQPPQWVTDLGVPIASRQTLLQPGRQLPGLHVLRDGGQWTGHLYELPGCPRACSRRTPPDKPARAGSPT
jgi:hypothetical protein